MLQKLFFDLMYRFRRPPWDTGITPPEVVSLVASGDVKVGRALDLGCGTGTNALYLAQHGFQVVGVDFSPKAIALARAKANQQHVPVEFVSSDVTRLDFLKEPFDFILDIGCFHSIPSTDRDRYAAQIRRLSRPRSMYLLYAFAGASADNRLFSAGISQGEVKQLFAPFMDLCRVETGSDRGERTSSWYWFKRKE
jgi:ubiquinone/menaquinone biosynthesis C-methylase UbiE